MFLNLDISKLEFLTGFVVVVFFDLVAMSFHISQASAELISYVESVREDLLQRIYILDAFLRRNCAHGIWNSQMFMANTEIDSLKRQLSIVEADLRRWKPRKSSKAHRFQSPEIIQQTAVQSSPSSDKHKSLIDEDMLTGDIPEIIDKFLDIGELSGQSLPKEIITDIHIPHEAEIIAETVAPVQVIPELIPEAASSQVPKVCIQEEIVSPRVEIDEDVLPTIFIPEELWDQILSAEVTIDEDILPTIFISPDLWEHIIAPKVTIDDDIHFPNIFISEGLWESIITPDVTIDDIQQEILAQADQLIIIKEEASVDHVQIAENISAEDITPIESRQIRPQYVILTKLCAVFGFSEDSAELPSSSKRGYKGISGRRMTYALTARYFYGILQSADSWRIKKKDAAWWAHGIKGIWTHGGIFVQYRSVLCALIKNVGVL